MKEQLGFDEVLNYKDKDFRKKFKEATPKFVDVYWDNGKSNAASLSRPRLTPAPLVGGDILDIALGRANTYARFVMCGAISQYNSTDPKGPRQIAKVITQRIRMEGFIVFDYIKEYNAARKQLAQWLSEGKLKRQETIVKGGLKVAENTLVELYKGVNTGKLSYRSASKKQSY